MTEIVSQNLLMKGACISSHPAQSISSEFHLKHTEVDITDHTTIALHNIPAIKPKTRNNPAPTATSARPTTQHAAAHTPLMLGVV